MNCCCSTGEGAERCITVTPPASLPSDSEPKDAKAQSAPRSESVEIESRVDATTNPFEALLDGSPEPDAEEAAEEPPLKCEPCEPHLTDSDYTCEACGKTLPLSNRALHDEHCWRRARAEQQEKEAKEAAKLRRAQKDEKKLLESYRNDVCWKAGCSRKLDLLAMVGLFIHQFGAVMIT